MRCPHCGFVSFDAGPTCRRCAKPVGSSQGQSADPSDAVHPAWRPAAGEVFDHEVDWNRLALPEELRVPPSLGTAGIARRGIALLVDAPFLLILSILAMTTAYLVALGGGTVAGAVTVRIELWGVAAALGAAVAVSFAYHVVSWGGGGQTPGKMLMGVQVVRQDGAAIGYGRAFVRWIGYCCALLPLGLGFVLALMHPRRRGLHDLLAGTCVVRVDAGPDLSHDAHEVR